MARFDPQPGETAEELHARIESRLRGMVDEGLMSRAALVDFFGDSALKTFGVELQFRVRGRDEEEALNALAEELSRDNLSRHLINIWEEE